jgi:MHS family alpha-ketoglutarate permease-like MFS transporter
MPNSGRVMAQSPSPSPSDLSPRAAFTNSLRASAGNLVEWFDVYVYAVFAVHVEAQFFARDDPYSSLWVWGVFGVTFLVRPIGSWWFGRLADRRGRRTALSISVGLMAGCSFIIAMTPTYESLGPAAAAVLIGCRLVQGVATGGEFGASAVYLVEIAPTQRRGLFSSVQYVTLIGGHVLAQVTMLVMLSVSTETWIGDWGWRVAFAIGGAGALVVFWLRRGMVESLAAGNVAAAGGHRGTSSSSLSLLLTTQRTALIRCVLITIGGTIAFYSYSVNGPKMVQAAFAGEGAMTGTVITLVALILLMLLQPVGGWLADRVGWRPLLVAFGIGGVLYSSLFYWLLPQATDPFAAFTLLMIGFVIVTGVTSISALAKSQLFPMRLRALGVGFGHAIAASVFGGTAPMLFGAASATGEVPLFSGYVTVVIACSLVGSVLILRDRNINELDRERSSSDGTSIALSR